MNEMKGWKNMKKLLIVLLLIGFAVFITRDNEEKQVQKERNVQQIEKNIQPYLIDWFIHKRKIKQVIVDRKSVV